MRLVHHIAVRTVQCVALVWCMCIILRYVPYSVWRWCGAGASYCGTYRTVCGAGVVLVHHIAVRTYSVWRWCGAQCQNLHTKFHENVSATAEFETQEHTVALSRIDPIFIHSFCYERKLGQNIVRVGTGCIWFRTMGTGCMWFRTVGTGCMWFRTVFSGG